MLILNSAALMKEREREEEEEERINTPPPPDTHTHTHRSLVFKEPLTSPSLFKTGALMSRLVHKQEMPPFVSVITRAALRTRC